MEGIGIDGKLRKVGLKNGFGKRKEKKGELVEKVFRNLGIEEIKRIDMKERIKRMLKLDIDNEDEGIE